MRMGVLADDCSGALASAARLRAHGLQTRVAWDTDTTQEGVEALVIDMRTRDEARAPEEHARRWARWLLERGCQQFELRVDSTLRGDPAAELRGLLAGGELTDATVVAVPAFPGAERVTVDGRQRAPVGPDGEVFVREVGPCLFGRRPHANVPLEVIEAGVQTLEEHLGTERGRGVRRFVLDATTDTHLQSAAAAVARMSRDEPVVTASPGAWLRWHPLLDGVVVAVLASPTPQNVEQLAQLERERSTVVVDGSRTTARPRLDPEARTVVVETLRAAAPAAAERLGRSAAATALDVLTELRQAGRRIAGVIASGGHTAACVLDALRPTALDAECELAPLCPAGTVSSGPWAGLRFVTKGGIVGERSTLADLASTLHEEPTCPIAVP